MLDESHKADLTKRLNRAAGQVAGVRRMIDEDAYCVDILMQVSAAIAALGRVGSLVLENHISTCVSDAFQADDEATKKQKIKELMQVFSRYANFPSR